MASMVKQYWPVKTFWTQADENYKIAIDYYAQKKKNFLSMAKQKKQQMLNQIKTIESVEDLVNKEVAKFNNDITKNWEQIYHSKISQSDLHGALTRWNKMTHLINQTTVSALGLFQLINQLSLGIAPISVSNQSLASISAISLNFLQQLTAQVAQSGLTDRQYAGIRARALGEIFENLVSSCAQANLSNIFQVLPIGSKNTGIAFTAKGKKRPVQGKTDILLSLDTLTLSDNTKGLVTATNSLGHNVPLDALSWCDIEENGIQNFNTFLSGPGGNALGISAKQWSESIIGQKTGASSRASFGNSRLTAAYVASRWSPKGTISWVFADTHNFTAYTGYIVSRYLINVIGAHNAIVAFGNQMYFTDQWLQKIRSSSLMIAHSFGQGAIASKKRGTITEKNAYNVTSHLVVAYTQEKK